MFLEGSGTNGVSRCDGESKVEKTTPPPLPSKRGAIRQMRKEREVTARLSPSRLQAFVEHAHKGNVRTTLRVRSPADSRKESWAEVTAKHHRAHARIIREIANAVNAGRVASKPEARRMRDELLHSTR